MGRMNPAPAEAARGSSAGAVAAQWREHEMRRMLRIGDFTPYDRAYDTLAVAVEFCHDGGPNHIAVMALVDLRRRHKTVTPRMLRAAVWSHLNHKVRIRRWTVADRDRYLADELPNLLANPHRQDAAA